MTIFMKMMGKYFYVPLSVSFLAFSLLASYHYCKDESCFQSINYSFYMLMPQMCQDKTGKA